MTTEEYTRQYMPGDVEKKADSERFNTIVKCVETGTPLPDGFESVLEAATASYIKARCAEMRAGMLPKVGYQKCVNDMRRRFLTEYRAFVMQRTRYREILHNGLNFSQRIAHLLKNIGEMSDSEIIDELLTLFGVVFNESEEMSLRKRWNEGKTAKAKKTKKTKKCSTSVLELPDELREAWDGFEQMRKAKHKPMTERAAKMMYKKLLELAGGDVALAKTILDESTRNGWTDVYLPKAEKKKQEIYSSNASYDIKAFEEEENLVALKYLEE